LESLATDGQYGVLVKKRDSVALEGDDLSEEMTQLSFSQVPLSQKRMQLNCSARTDLLDFANKLVDAFLT
jgi:hypothetical protein